VLLVGLGDSVTAGFGASKGHSYFQRLAANPEDEFPDMKGICLGAVLPRLKVRNLAVSGSTSLEHLQDQVPRVPPAGPETFGLVVMTTGGNDIIHNYGRTPPREGAMYGATVAQAKPWIASFEKRLDAMVRRIEGRFPGGCRIYLANVYDPTDGVGDAQNAGLPGWRDGLPVIRAYNEVIARCPRRHPSVRVVNLHDAFLGHGIHCAQFWRREYRKDDPRYWYYENLEDPNDRGYDAIRRLFLIEMARDASSIR
jgi:lysophospholipase L1-like esterase